ncbi:ankyrin repeat-containing domain protein [Infundibulicybe gibba]|nr:ankyrin repeat-containing domain protein [Infundibulicybe gibba]
MPAPPKNIWVAAGDGDLERVRELVEHQALSPNTPDPFTYTPMHAAASYGHLHVLDYLISRGGDVNITDADGDSPLYTVENVETARFLVQHGAVIDRTNNESISPIEHLSEDFPEVSAYLQTLAGSSTSVGVPTVPSQPSQHQQNIASENLTSALMVSVQDIMQRAEAEGRDPEGELREVVGRTVLEGVVTGFEMTTDQNEPRRETNDTPTKKPRIDGNVDKNGPT